MLLRAQAERTMLEMLGWKKIKPSELSRARAEDQAARIRRVT